MRWTRENYEITDDRNRVDVRFVERMLRDSYWAAGRSRAAIERTVAESICFSLFLGDRQIGFSRVVSDHVQIAWIGDVVVDPEYRGKGLGGWLMDCVLEHPCCTDVKSQILRTRDAHSLYTPRGFEPEEYLVRVQEKNR